MMRSYGAKSYVEGQVLSATPLQLVVLLCDAAVQSAGTAHDAMVRRDLHTRRAAVNKLMAIIAELQGSLDLEQGGAVARRLDGLYTYMFSKLLDAVARQAPEPIDEVRRILVTLRDAWQQAAQQPAPAATDGTRP
jgi:flagellar secretion chaperone FliS